jgi:small subunit ribosomal protein S21|tara:strand:- start:7 stop:195 length:189 start_codon:yes stop_codon:yes gene_type:complete
MLKIEVKKKNIERSLKELKRKFIKTKSLQECRDRKHHTKKSIKRRETINKAKYLQKKYDSEN